MRRLLLGFPGQGSQKVGAGQQLAESFPRSAGRVFQIANETLDGLFSELVWNASSRNDVEKQLSLTINTQPIVLTTSIAVVETLKELGTLGVSQKTIGAMVGHSLGEFTCLVASGALEFPDALRLVRLRGEAMQRAADEWGKRPAMSAVLGLSWDNAKQIESSCPPGLLVQAVCANGPEQTVLAGCDEGVAWGIDQARTRYGARRGLKVNVSCPFHSKVMEPAALAFAPHLDRIRILEPRVPIVFGVDAKPRSDAKEIKSALIQGMASPVMWADSVRAASSMYGPLRFQELGGDTLRFGVNGVDNLQVAKAVKADVMDVQAFTL